jgi:hypothetical protein
MARIGVSYLAKQPRADKGWHKDELASGRK